MDHEQSPTIAADSHVNMLASNDGRHEDWLSVLQTSQKQEASQDPHSSWEVVSSGRSSPCGSSPRWGT